MSNPWFDSVLSILTEPTLDGRPLEAPPLYTPRPLLVWTFGYNQKEDWWVLRCNRHVVYTVTTQLLKQSYLSPADIFVEIIRELTKRGYDTRDLTPSVFMDPWEQYNLATALQGLT